MWGALFWYADMKWIMNESHAAKITEIFDRNSHSTHCLAQRSVSMQYLVLREKEVTHTSAFPATFIVQTALFQWRCAQFYPGHFSSTEM